MADPDAVPAGKYGKAALEASGAVGPCRRQGRRAENVRAALALVESGEAPLGIVYATDAAARAKVRVVADLPRREPSADPSTRWRVLAASKNGQAESFEQFLGRPGPGDLRRFGFNAANDRGRPPRNGASSRCRSRSACSPSALTLPFAYGLAWLLARRRFPGRGSCSSRGAPAAGAAAGGDRLGAAAAVRPHRAARAPGSRRTFGLVLVFRWTGAALAAAVMALPLMVRAMRLSIEAVDRRLVGAARTLGATPWRAFATITLPLSLPGVLAGDDARLRRARSANSARRSPSSRTSPARRTRCRWRSTRDLQVPGAESRASRGWRSSRCCSRSPRCSPPSWLVRRSHGRRAHVL